MIQPLIAKYLPYSLRPFARLSNRFFFGKARQTYSSFPIGSAVTPPRYAFGSKAESEPERQPHFDAFITSPDLLRNLSQNSMTAMFPIQSATFKLILEGRDVLARDRTGSGKTIAYMLPILQQFYKSKINPRTIKNPLFLVLCPTRELTLQVANQIKKFTSEYKVATLYGGAPISNQIKDLERGAAIVVATPGRLIDFLDRQAVSFSDLKVVCIDQADTMLEKGFKLDVQRIFKQVNSQAAGKTQNLMFSATIPSWVANITQRYLTNCATINMIKDESARTSQTVEHYALMVRESEKYQTVLRLIQRYNPHNRTIIFTQTKVEANEFIRYFDTEQIVILHGDIPQGARENNIGKFKAGQMKVLIATDVASRGLDIPNVELVIQLSPPENPEPYIHRSGRTGRAGKAGTNITFFDASSVQDLLRIESEANIQIRLINDNFNIALWMKQARNLTEEVAESRQSKDDAFYQIFVKEILKKAKPEQALLHFLRQKLGKVPQSSSSITSKKGYITYLAHKRHPDAPPLTDVFHGLEIFHLTHEQDLTKFDVLSNDFHKLQGMIENQQDYDLETIDENASQSLRQFSQKMAGDRGFRTEGRYGQDRGRYGQDRDRQDRHQPRQRHQRSQARFGFQEAETKNIYISRISSGISNEALEEEIKRQSGVKNFRLKVITKNGLEGEFKFGFIELEDSKDSKKLLGSGIYVNGQRIPLREARER